MIMRTKSNPDIPIEVDTQIEKKLIRVLAVALGLFLASLISFFVYISQLDGRVKVLEDRQSIILEIKGDVKELKADFSNFRIEMMKDRKLASLDFKEN